MTQDNEIDKNGCEGESRSKASIFAIVTGVIMVAIYVGMAFLLLFTNLFIGKVPEWVRYLMGVVFFIYAIFRGYRVYANNR
ncbi:MAG: hypothetical protein IKA91_04255 [Bacteroidaceae bacterium]|nr:hypothetical protein [Bacteroidaceae bacterium]